MKRSRIACGVQATFAVAASCCLRSVQANEVSQATPKSSWTAPAQAARQANPLPANEQAIARGKALYVKECVPCHGATGKETVPKLLTSKSTRVTCPAPRRSGKPMESCSGSSPGAELRCPLIVRDFRSKSAGCSFIICGRWGGKSLASQRHLQNLPRKVAPLLSQQKSQARKSKVRLSPDRMCPDRNIKSSRRSTINSSGNWRH